jgi:hypothetical protein
VLITVNTRVVCDNITVLNANIFQTIHLMETEIASFKRGERPLSNNTSFMLQLCINVFTSSNFKYVNNFMNVTERDGVF